VEQPRPEAKRVDRIWLWASCISMRSVEALSSACENVLTGHHQTAGVGSDVGRTEDWRPRPDRSPPSGQLDSWWLRSVIGSARAAPVPWNDSWNEHQRKLCAMGAFRALRRDIRAVRALLALQRSSQIRGFWARAPGAPPAKTSLVDLVSWDKCLVPRNTADPACEQGIRSRRATVSPSQWNLPITSPRHSRLVAVDRRADQRVTCWARFR